MILKKKNKKLNKKINSLIPTFGNIYIKANFKNTIISLTTLEGNVLKQWSTKSLKKKQHKKNTPYNLQLIASKINKYIIKLKINRLNIFIKGFGFGRYYIVKNINQKKIKIKTIFDKTSIPFNGCRKKKQKRR